MTFSDTSTVSASQWFPTATYPLFDLIAPHVAHERRSLPGAYDAGGFNPQYPINAALIFRPESPSAINDERVFCMVEKSRSPPRVIYSEYVNSFDRHDCFIIGFSDEWVSGESRIPYLSVYLLKQMINRNA